MTKTLKEQLKFLEESLDFQIALHKQKTDELLRVHKVVNPVCFGINAGHGGINQSGQYTTAPSKMFEHKGKGEKFHSGSWFYEGVFNRVIANKLCKRLKAHKLQYKKFYHSYEDWNLGYLVKSINNYHQNTKRVVLLSLHSNASSKHNARGFSVWTSRGQTKSDKSATKIYQLAKGILEPEFRDRGFKMLKQSYRDADPDYEKDFTILKKTYCEAILLECLFFDQIDDARLLMDETFQDQYVEVLLKYCIWRNEQGEVLK